MQNARTVSIPYAYSVTGRNGRQRIPREHSFVGWVDVDLPDLRSDALPGVVVDGPSGRGPRRLAVVGGRLAMRLAFPLAEDIAPQSLRTFMTRWTGEPTAGRITPKYRMYLDRSLPFAFDSRTQPLKYDRDDVRDRTDCDRDRRAEAARRDARRRLRIVDGRLVRIDLEVFADRTSGIVAGLVAAANDVRFVAGAHSTRLVRLPEVPAGDPRLPSFAGDLDALRYRIDGEAAAVADLTRRIHATVGSFGTGPDEARRSLLGPQSKAALGRKPVDREALFDELRYATRLLEKARVGRSWEEREMSEDILVEARASLAVDA